MHHVPSRLALTALAALTIGCAGDTPTEAADHASLHANARAGGGNSVAAAGLAQAVRAATSRFHSTAQATKAGYAEASPCVASPAGGMGYHWVNTSLVDATFDPYQPEAVLYEPDARGNLHLVAIEYIVVDEGQPRPSFGDYPVDIGGGPFPFPHYTLHVWLHKDNPSGMFAPFNPTVSCPAP